MKSEVIAGLENVEEFLEFFINGNDAAIEYYYTVGPNQGLVPRLRAAATRAKLLLINSVNSGKILSPLLIAQALLYFFKAGVSLIRMGLTRKINGVTDVIKVALDVLAGLFATTLAALMLLGYYKWVAVVFCVQAGVDVLVEAGNFFRKNFGYFKKSYQVFKLKQQIKLAKIPAEKNDLQNKLKVVERERAEATVAIKASAKKLGKKIALAGIILALTVLSFFCPIPIVSNIAQVALVVIVTCLTVKACVDRYKQYKANKALKQEKAQEKEVANTQTAKAADKLTLKVKLTRHFTAFKQKIAKVFSAAPDNTSKANIKNKVAIAAAAVVLTMGTAGAASDLTSTAHIVQTTSVVKNVDTTKTENRDLKNKSDQNANDDNFIERNKRVDDSIDDPTPNVPPVPEDSIITTGKSEEEQLKETSSRAKKPDSYKKDIMATPSSAKSYGSRTAALQYYKQQFFNKRTEPKIQYRGISEQLLQDQQNLTKNFPSLG